MIPKRPGRLANPGRLESLGRLTAVGPWVFSYRTPVQIIENDTAGRGWTFWVVSRGGLLMDVPRPTENVRCEVFGGGGGKGAGRTLPVSGTTWTRDCSIEGGGVVGWGGVASGGCWLAGASPGGATAAPSCNARGPSLSLVTLLLSVSSLVSPWTREGAGCRLATVVRRGLFRGAGRVCRAGDGSGGASHSGAVVSTQLPTTAATRSAC